MSRPLEVREYVVEPDCPARLAGALVRYRLTRSVTSVFVVIGVVGLVFAVGAGQGLAVAVFAAVLVLAGLGFLTQYRGTARLLASGAYRPGTRLAVEWFDDRFVLSAPQASASHAYRDVRSVSERGGFVLLAMRTGRQVLVLPADLVDERGRDLLASGGSAGRP